MSNPNPKYSYQSSRYQDADINDFDFAAPAEQYKDFQELIANSYLARKNKHFWQSTHFLSIMTLFFMLLSLGTLGYLVLIQDHSNSIASTISSKLGNNQTTNIIPAKNFTIISATKAPVDFGLVKVTPTYKPSFLKPDSISMYKYSAITPDINNSSKAELEITSVDFDYKFDQQTFGQLVAKDFGGDWKVTDNKVGGNKGIVLSRLENLQNPKQIYYTTATSNYYYIVKVDKSLEGFKDAEKINDYLGSLIESVYFN